MPRKIFFLLVLALLLVGCVLPQPTETATPGGPTATSSPTMVAATATTAVPSPTAFVSSTPSPTFSPTPTQTDSPPVPAGTNLLKNPGFEGSTRPVGFGEVNVYQDWQPFYCDEPYTPTQCAAYMINQGNPPGLLMGRPEYKPIPPNPGPYEGYGAQHWFCFWRTCVAGVYQTVATVPGQVCEAGAYVRSWSNYDSDPESELESADDRANSRWFIKIDLLGGSFAFADSNWPPDLDGEFASGMWGYEDGIYDHWLKISIRFKPIRATVTIFWGDARLWPIENNDSYIDSAWVVCWDEGDPQPGVGTPQPLPTPVPGTPTLEPTPTRIFACDPGQDVESNRWFYQSNYSMNLRSAPQIGSDTLLGKTLPAGTVVPVICHYLAPNETDVWVYVTYQGFSAWAAVSIDQNNDGLGEVLGEVLTP